jgi:hypothetical protein
MNRVNRLSRDCRGAIFRPNQVASYLPLEREGKEAFIDLLSKKHAEQCGRHQPAGEGFAVAGRMPKRGSSQFPLSLTQAARAAFHQTVREIVLGMLSRTQ